MISTRLFTVLALFICLLSITTAKFDEARAKTLLGKLRNTKLLKSVSKNGKRDKRVQKNRKLVESAINLLGTRLSSCTPAVCFALDGSDALSTSEFETQRSFVQIAASLLGALDGAQLAAVQYNGDVNSPDGISPLVFANPDGPQFLTALDYPNLIQANSNPTFVEGGIQYCIDEFGSNMPSKILILGDSDTNHGSVAAQNDAITVAEDWDNLGLGNDLCAGLIGHGSDQFFIDLVGGVNTDVRRPRNWDLLIEDIEDFFLQICN